MLLRLMPRAECGKIVVGNIYTALGLIRAASGVCGTKKV
jgi:hypothetical protein